MCTILYFHDPPLKKDVTQDLTTKLTIVIGHSDFCSHLSLHLNNEEQVSITDTSVCVLDAVF